MKKKTPNEQKGPSQRQLRVGEQLRHIIAETMGRGHFHDELLLGVSSKVTVTEVVPSPDLRQATVYVISLGGADMTNILPALNKNANVFQKDISGKSNLKFTAKVRFKEDTSFEKAQKLDALLSTIQYSDQEED